MLWLISTCLFKFSRLLQVVEQNTHENVSCCLETGTLLAELGLGNGWSSGAGSLWDLPLPGKEIRGSFFRGKQSAWYQDDTQEINTRTHNQEREQMKIKTKGKKDWTINWTQFTTPIWLKCSLKNERRKILHLFSINYITIHYTALINTDNATFPFKYKSNPKLITQWF